MKQKQNHLYEQTFLPYPFWSNVNEYLTLYTYTKLNATARINDNDSQNSFEI